MGRVWVSAVAICFGIGASACSSEKPSGSTPSGTAGTGGLVGVGSDGGKKPPAKDAGTAADAGPQLDANVTTPANPDFNPGVNDPTKKPADTTPINGPAPVAAVCGTPYRNFNLSGFEPVNSPSFKTAWDSERRTSEVPGIVLAFRDLLSGPARARVGSVHGESNPEVFGFNDPGSHDMLTPAVTKTPGTVTLAFDDRANFSVAFGTRSLSGSHRGFSVMRLTFNFNLDGFCEEIAEGSTFTLRIPSTNRDLPFGGSTIGALLGQEFVDTNADNVPDAWDVTFRGGTSSVVILSQ